MVYRCTSQTSSDVLVLHVVRKGFKSPESHHKKIIVIVLLEDIVTVPVTADIATVCCDVQVYLTFILPQSNKSFFSQTEMLKNDIVQLIDNSDNGCHSNTWNCNVTY